MRTFPAFFEKITAVFAVSEHYALEFMRFLQGQSIRVPEDVQIIGFDDTLASRESVPALTTIHQDAVNAAATALHKAKPREHIRDHLISPHRRNVPDIHILHPAAIHHAARRSDFQPIIEHFHMNLRTKNLIIPMNQRIDQHLTNGFIRVITAFFTGHTTDFCCCCEQNLPHFAAA